MRTAPAALRRGVARTLLAHLIALAQSRGYTRLSLETGTAPTFDAANRLYETSGFVDCAAFGGYPESPHNRFMTLALSGGRQSDHLRPPSGAVMQMIVPRMSLAIVQPEGPLTGAESGESTRDRSLAARPRRPAL